MSYEDNTFFFIKIELTCINFGTIDEMCNGDLWAKWKISSDYVLHVELRRNVNDFITFCDLIVLEMMF